MHRNVLVFKMRKHVKSMSVFDCLTARQCHQPIRGKYANQPALMSHTQSQDLGKLISNRFDKEVEGLKLNRSTQIL